MKETFRGYYRPTDEEFTDLWRECVFILDANVLLNLYRYPKGARDDLLKILRQVSSRLWVPYQAALEYQENRLTVISEQRQKYDKVIKIIDDAENKFSADLLSLQLAKRHSKINPERYLEKINEVYNEFRKELRRFKKEQPSVQEEDAIREEIDVLLRDKIGPKPQNQKEIDAIYEEGEFRYKVKRPPGYLDSDKSEDEKRPGYNYGGIFYKKAFGDLILWYQIIKQAKQNDNFKKIILIADDYKEDWWWIEKSGGKKTIGPRPELVEEIYYKADVSCFHMYNSERFMEFAIKYIGAKIKTSSIGQIRDFGASGGQRTEISLSPVLGESIFEQAVTKWILYNYPRNAVLRTDGFPDILAYNAEDGTHTGYELGFFYYPTVYPKTILDDLYKGIGMVNERELDYFYLILTALDDEVLNEVKKKIAANGEISALSDYIIFGLLNIGEKVEESIFKPS